MLQLPKQFTHLKYQRVRKYDIIATIGVVFILWITALNLLPKQFEGELRYHAYYILNLSFITVVSLCTGLFFFINKSHWSFSVLRFVAFSNAVWFFSGTLIQIYALYVDSNTLNTFVDEIWHTRIQAVFSFGLGASTLYELWKYKRLRKD